MRLYRYDALSLWFDEGVSLYLARLPWHEVLLNIQFYDTHPAGYPVVLKLVSDLLPEAVAGRLLSVICGTLTILVLYFLARSLMGSRAALLAALALAVSPLHIWYSQEARPYAAVALLVALSYLALVTFHLKPSWLPASLYGASTLFALYYDYSALFALAPQAIILSYIAWVHRRNAFPIFISTLAALVLFIPGALTMIGTVSAMAQERLLALGATPERIGGVSLSVMGVLGHDRYFLGNVPTLWETGDGLRWLILALLVIVASYGTQQLVRTRRASPMALMVSGGLLVGTLLVGIVISLYKPGFAERTVLSAALGWSLLIGAIAMPVSHPLRFPRSVWLVGRAGVALALILTVVFSSYTVYAIYSGGDKDHWRDLAADSMAFSSWGYPLITYHVVVPVLLDVYQPQLLQSNHIPVPPDTTLGTLTNTNPLPPAVWLDYIEIEQIDDLRARLSKLGYTRIIHNSYGQNSLNPIYMDLYAQPSAAQALTHELLPGNTGSGTQGWTLPADTTVRPTEQGGGFLTNNTQPSEARASQAVPAQPGKLYSFTFQARSELETGRVRSFLICTGPNDQWLSIAPDYAGATEPNDSAWHNISVSTLCPATTTGLLLDVRNAGIGTVEFREFNLASISPSP